MKTKQKHLLVGLLCVITASLCPLSISAQQTSSISAQGFEQTYTENPVPYWSYITSAYAGINISGGSCTATSTLIGIPGTTTKVEAYTYLQKYQNNRWETVSNWYDSSSGYRGAFTHSKSVSSGKYRVMTSFYSYSGNSYEQYTAYSSEINC